MIGVMGSGKSAIGNVISKTYKFQESQGVRGVNKEIQIEKFENDGTSYRIIDTVGLGDPNFSREDILISLEGAVQVIGKGINQIFFVSDAASRISNEEVNAYK